MSSNLRAACLEYADGTYKLLNFQPRPDHDLRRSAELEGLKHASRPFVVCSIIPTRVDSVRYIERKNAGLCTAMERGADGHLYYLDRVRKGWHMVEHVRGERA